MQINHRIKKLKKYYIKKTNGDIEGGKMFDRAVPKIIDEFTRRHKIEDDTIEYAGGLDLRFGGEYGTIIDFDTILYDLAFYVPKGMIFDYIDHKIEAENNKLKPLLYEEFLKIKGLKNVGSLDY